MVNQLREVGLAATVKGSMANWYVSRVKLLMSRESKDDDEEEPKKVT